MVKLTKRQAQVLDLVMQAKTDKQISKALGIKLPTVKSHIKKLFRAKGVHSRLELIIKEYKEMRDIVNRLWRIG